MTVYNNGKPGYGQEDKRALRPENNQFYSKDSENNVGARWGKLWLDA